MPRKVESCHCDWIIKYELNLAVIFFLNCKCFKLLHKDLTAWNLHDSSWRFNEELQTILRDFGLCWLDSITVAAADLWISQCTTSQRCSAGLLTITVQWTRCCVQETSCGCGVEKMHNWCQRTQDNVPHNTAGPSPPAELMIQGRMLSCCLWHILA